MAKICLDAGHYGKYNQSPAEPAYYESEMNWKLHLLLKKELEGYGFTVITTREDPEEDLGLASRGKKSEGCDLFLSLHSNAVGDEVREDVDYVVAYVQLDGSGDELGLALAQTVAELMDTYQEPRTNTRRGNRGEYYGVLRGAATVGTVGIILEHSFHTNTKSTRWLMKDSNLEKLAKAEAKVLADYFGMEKWKMLTMEIPVLKKGMKGEPVKGLQALLLGYGYDLGASGIDGSFGGATERALKRFQSDRGLDPDGSCGRKTWTTLLGLT